MENEANRKYCVKYCMNHGMSESEAETFSWLILCAYQEQKEKTLGNLCDFALGVLESLEEDRVQRRG